MKKLWLPIFILGAFFPLNGVKGQGLKGLGPPGGLNQTDPKVLALEMELLKEINALRARRKLEPISMDNRIRDFARFEVKLAANGDPSAKAINERIKKRGMAPYGYYIQYLHGVTAARIIKDIKSNRSILTQIYADFPRVGIGAFLVPDKKPYFQVLLFLARDPDPMSGKPGLSQAQTDKVMHRANPLIKQCYDAALQKDPNTKGNLILKIIIGSDGGVDQVVLLKKMGHPGFEGCVLEVTQNLSFPKPYKGKPVTLNHPLSFTPPQGDRRIGKLTKAQIEGAFRKARYQFKSCYNKRVKEKPQMKGTIKLAITVRANGGVKNVEVTEDGIEDRILTNCVLKVANELRFARPKHNGEVEITYPLYFEPSF